MKDPRKIIGLSLIDAIFIWWWVYEIDPDPSVSIGVIILVPLVFGVNLIIAGFLFIVKQKDYSKLFLINSVIASVLMFYLFIRGIDRHLNNTLESWEFTKSDTTFFLDRRKETNEFSLTYQLSPGSSTGVLFGEVERVNNDWVLTADTIKMIIHNNHLIGFRVQSDTIKMNKVKR